MKHIFIPEEQQISPQHLERVGPWLRVNHCIRTDTFQIPSTGRKEKNTQEKAKSQTQKGVAQRENNTKPSVSLVKSLCNIPNIMLLDYDIS